MKAIKFRAWDGSHILPVLAITFEGHMMVTVGRKPTLKWWIEDVILEQFTGLLDKNGKEVYDGDIIMMDEEAVISPNEAVVVEYDFGVPLSHPVDSRFYNTTCIHELCADNLGNYKPHHGIAGVVIGNINENPELIHA